MNNFVIDTPDNFWQIRWLDKYMEGHKGFIAGGCFKNILSGERVKDIDIFFEMEGTILNRLIGGIIKIVISQSLIVIVMIIRFLVIE